MWYEELGITKPYFGDDYVCLLHGDCREILPELLEGLSQRQQIIGMLKGGALSSTEIAEGLGVTENHARILLNRNKRDFVKTEGGKWGLLIH